MTIRRLASAILTTSIRSAPPEAQEWGNAMLREMDFIEGDWAVLFWALGSATALFRRVEAPMPNSSDILSRTQALMKKIQRRTLGGYSACLVLIVYFGWFIFIPPNGLARMGSGLTVAAMLYVAYQLHARRNRKLPSGIQPSACAAFYRAELERQRDFHCGQWFWSRLIIVYSGYMLFLVGLAVANPSLELFVRVVGACAVVLFIVSVPLNLRLSRKYQRQIDEIDSLPKEP